MRIGFFELEGWEEKELREKFVGHELFFSSEKITPERLPERGDLEVVCVFVNSRITPEVLDALPNLKLIATRSTGFDHLDMDAIRARGVEAVYVPGYGDNTVAEFAFGLLLNLTRKIYQAADQVKRTGSFGVQGLRGIDLHGKTIGIIGTGRIGKEMVRIAQGFGMSVLAFDLFPDITYAREKSFEYVELSILLRRSQFISIHCPHTKETDHLINRENIKLVNPGAYLINTARGGVVETAALVEALDAGILAGVGLDVLEEEGEMHEELDLLKEGGHPKEGELKILLENHWLMRRPEVLITPHVAFNSQEAFGRILSVTIENILHYTHGEVKNSVPRL